MKQFLRAWVTDADRLSAVFLSLATLATSWCALEASLWSGRQTFDLAHANAGSREAMFYENRANQERLLMAVLFTNLAEAYLLDQKKLLAYYLSRLPEKTGDSLTAWFETPGRHRIEGLASITDSAILRKERTAARIKQESDTQLQAAEKANGISDRYVLVTVLFASVLFCAVMGSKSKAAAFQLYYFGCAAAVAAVALVILAELPVAFPG